MRYPNPAWDINEISYSDTFEIVKSLNLFKISTKPVVEKNISFLNSPVKPGIYCSISIVWVLNNKYSVCEKTYQYCTL